MRVLHVVPWYEPAWGAGGTATAVAALCRALARAGLDVTVYTTDDAGGGQRLRVPLGEPVRLGGVEVRYFRCGVPCMHRKAAFYSRGLCDALNATIDDFDLVHLSSTRHWHGFQAHRLATMRGVPYLVSPHASLMKWFLEEVGARQLRLPKLLYLRFLGAAVIKHARAIHYLCEGERQASSQYQFGRPSFIVPNGVSLGRFERREETRAQLRSEHGIPDGALSLLYLGRVHPLKNVHLVIEALRRIGSARLFLSIVGPVSDRAYYRKLTDAVQAHGLDSVRFFPQAGRDEVAKWYAMADLMVLPSKVEGVSMAVIEALAASLPVLLSDRVANHRELEADRAGVVVDPSAQSIEWALGSLLSKPVLLAELSRNARRAAEARYAIDRVASDMLTAYGNVLSGRRDPVLSWH